MLLKNRKETEIPKHNKQRAVKQKNKKVRRRDLRDLPKNQTTDLGIQYTISKSLYSQEHIIPSQQMLCYTKIKRKNTMKNYIDLI